MLGEFSAYRQKEERQAQGERTDPEKELPATEPYSYALEHPYMFTPEQASAVRKAQEEGKTAEAWGILEDASARRYKQAAYDTARLDQDARNRADRHNLPKSDNKLADTLETGAEITGTLALWIILSKAKGAQFAFTAMSTAGSFLETFNKEMKSGKEPTEAFHKAGGETAYGVTKEMIISAGVAKMFGGASGKSFITENALSAAADAFIELGKNKNDK